MTVLTGTLGLGRSMAAQRFTETLTFFAETTGAIPEGSIDPAIVETTIHADVAGQVKFPSLQVSDREQAGQLFAAQQIVAKVGVGAAPNVRPDHFVRVTASTVDTSLVGRKFRVTGWPQGGQTTSHRYPLEEVS